MFFARDRVTGPSYEQLLNKNQLLREQLAERDRVVAGLEASVRDLQARLATVEKSAKR